MGRLESCARTQWLKMTHTTPKVPGHIPIRAIVALIVHRRGSSGSPMRDTRGARAHISLEGSVASAQREARSGDSVWDPYSDGQNLSGRAIRDRGTRKGQWRWKVVGKYRYSRSSTTPGPDEVFGNEVEGEAHGTQGRMGGLNRFYCSSAVKRTAWCGHRDAAEQTSVCQQRERWM